jgi:GTPase SAR1 family protein
MSSSLFKNVFLDKISSFAEETRKASGRLIDSITSSEKKETSPPPEELKELGGAGAEVVVLDAKEIPPPSPHRPPAADPSGPFNVMLFGNYGVGKTSMLNAFALDGRWKASTSFPPEAAELLMPCDPFAKAVKLDSGGPVTLKTWDTAGAERTHSFLPMYMRAIEAAVIVYAVDDRQSMQAIGRWHDEIQEAAGPNLVLWYLVASKMDTIFEAGKLSPEKASTMLYGMRLGKEFGITRFVSTSAATYDGVRQLFECIATDLSNSSSSASILPVGISDDASIEHAVRAHVGFHAAQALARLTQTATSSSSSSSASIPPLPLPPSDRGLRVIADDDGEEETDPELREHLRRGLRRARIRESGMYSFC